jgi:hypothetical protein
MMKLRNVCMLGALVLAATCSVARADQQMMAPGTGNQNAVVIDTGLNGICETEAEPDDIQASAVGQGWPYQAEIRCGTNKVVETEAAGDDTQLVPVGEDCNKTNTNVVDTGPDGIADTTANNAAVGGDDTTIIDVGNGKAYAPCVIAGINGRADTSPAVGDDVQALTLGSVDPNQAVILCGPNKIPETAANNVVVGGDDHQITALSAEQTCSTANTVVVDSGPNGIAETRAVGPDLVLKVARAVKVNIRKDAPSGSKTVKVQVSNQEFGETAPSSRTYQLLVTDGSCPRGTVSQVDADVKTAGIQTTASIPPGGKMRGSFLVTLFLGDIASVSKKIPYRCVVDVEADVVDPALGGAADDAAMVSNNSTSVDLEVVDRNDLP